MMRWIVGSSLRLRRIVVAVAAGVILLGIVSAKNTPVDLLPEYQPPTVEVQTEALGLSAAEVEQLITVPLEQDLLVGVPFLDDISSVSLPGVSSVVMTFEPGTDVLDARQLVQERLTQAVGVAGLPAVAKPPQMIQPVSSSRRVSMLKLTSEKLSPIEMSVLARWVIGPRLMGVPGVANVAVWGNRERQLQVLVDPDRLRAKGVTLPEVVRTAGNALEVSPLSYLEASKPGTGGFIDTPNQRFNIFHEQAITDATELAQVPVESTSGAADKGAGGRLALGDLTDVVESHQPLIGDTACGGGQSCLILVIEKFPGTNSGQVADDVDTALAALRPGLGDMRVDSSLYRPASDLDSLFSQLGRALLAGGILLVVVLLVLLRDWRRTAIVLATLAVSLACAVLVLNARDVSVNLLVLTGLVVGLTALVDDAASDTSATAQRVRRHRESGTSAPIWTTVVDSTVGLRRSALFAALVVGAATVPLFFLGDEGAAFVPPIVLSYLLAISVSFVVALLLTPALCLMLLSGGATEQRPSGRLSRRFDALVPQVVTRTVPALVVAGSIALVGLVAVPFVHTSFTPALEERTVVVRVEAAPGTSLPRMTAIASQAVEGLGAVPGVGGVNAHIGRAVMSDKAVNVNEGEIWLAIDEDADYDRTVRTIEDTVAGYEGVTSEVMTYTDQRVAEVLQSDDRDVAVRVYGDNPDVLTSRAEEIRSGIAGVDGVTRASIEPTPEETTLEVQVDLARAQALGVKPGDVRRAAAMLVGGVTVGNLFQDQKVFDVVVWGAPGIRQSLDDLRQLRIDTPAGETIRLGQVADVRERPDAAVIRHENVSRYVEVTADVSGRSVSAVNDDVKAAVAGVGFPLDHHAEVLGGYDDRQKAALRLVAVTLVAALVILLLLQAAFRSWRLAVVALLALPLSLVGGLAALLLTDGALTLGVVAGLVAVLGIAARAVVSTLDHLLHLQRREHLAWGPELVARGSHDRWAPILTTALSVAAVVAPLALGGGGTGFELLGPAAVAILGGLVTCTLVNAYVVPVVALRFGPGPDGDQWVDDLYQPAPDVEPVEA